MFSSVVASSSAPVRTLRSAGLAGIIGATALLWFLPFLWTEHRFPLTSLDSQLVAAGCLALALIASGLLPNRVARIQWPLPAVLAVLAALAFAQLQRGMLAYPQQATRFGLFLAAMVAAYALGREIVALGRLRSLMGFAAGAAVAGGVLSVFIQWLQVLDLEILPQRLALVAADPNIMTRPFANLAQANHLATYLGLATISAVYWQSRDRRLSPVLIPALCLIASGLAITGSRLAALFLILAIVALFAPTALRPASTRFRWVAVVAMLIGYAAGLVAVRTLAGEFDTLTRFGQETLPIRFQLWKQALEISLQHPWLGVGIGQFPAAQYWVAQAGPFIYPANNCHNLILQLAAELGWPAAIAVSALCLWWGLRDFRARVLNPELALVWTMVLLIAIHSMLEFPLWHLYFAIPASLLFALAEPETRGAVRADPRRILAVGGVAMLGITIALRIDYEGVAAQGASFWLDAALKLRKRNGDDAILTYALVHSYLFRPEAERLAMDLKNPPDEHTNDPLDRSSRVVQQLADPYMIARHIILLAQAGRIQEAVAYARRLPVFAREETGEYRDWLLERTRDIGPQTAALRHALREMQTSSAEAQRVVSAPTAHPLN
jgi:O-antigen ligase